MQGPEFVSFAWSVLWVSLSLVELFLLFGSVSSGSEAVLFLRSALIWVGFVQDVRLVFARFLISSELCVRGCF